MVLSLTSSAYWDDTFYRLTFDRCLPSKMKGSDLSQNYLDVPNNKLVGLDGAMSVPEWNQPVLVSYKQSWL